MLTLRRNSPLRRVARLLLIAVVTQWAAPPVFAAQDPGPSTFASTVTAIPSAQTNTFTDSALVGRPASDFTDRWIRFVTSANPAGFVTRVQSFDPLTGAFVLYDSIPAGSVGAQDVYLLGTHDGVAPAILPGDATANADAIVNNGTTSVDETKVIDPVLVPPDPLPDKSLIWINIIKTEAAATAVNGLAGADTIINTGTAASSATDVVLPGVVPTQLIGFKTSDVSSTAKATATGIDGGVDSDAITNAGTLEANASAGAAGASIQFAEASEDAGKAVLKGKVTAGATATGIAGGDGNDTVANRAAFDVTATSDTLAAGVAAVVNSGKAASSVKSSSDARATGIDLGADSDTLVNDNSVTATADSTAQALNVSIDARNPPEAPTGKIAPVSKPSKLKSTSDGGAEANAHATGILADSPATETKGDPQIDFTDAGITLSYGDASLTLKPQSITFQNQPSYAGNDSITNSADVTATATATVDAGSIGVGVNGHASSKVDSKAGSDAAAVDLGGGDDALTNTGHLLATADATANALDVTVSATTTSDPPQKFLGKVAAKLNDAGEYVLSKIHTTVDAGVSADSRAVGLSADGMGSDTGVKVTLSSQSDANDATVVGLSVEVTKTHGGDGADVVTNGAAIDATASATTRAVDVGVSIDGAASTDLKSNASATAAAIDLGGGDDTLTNSTDGTLTATADATADGLSLAVGVQKDAALKADISATVDGSVTSDAHAVGLSSDSTAADSSSTVDLTAGDGLIELSYTAKQTYASGNDHVENAAAITAQATSLSRAAAAGVAIGGDASAGLSSTATATAAAIELGGGNDTLVNTSTGHLTATADSTANALAVTVGVVTTDAPVKFTEKLKAQASSAKDTVTELVKPSIDTSTSATSHAVGLASDSTVADSDNQKTLAVSTGASDIPGGAALLDITAHGTLASGDDTVVNAADVDATATSLSQSGDVSVEVNGNAAAKVTSAATSVATAIDLGGGNDTIVNTGHLTATADATALGLGLAVGLSDSGSSGSSGSSSSPAKPKTPGSSADGSAKAEARAIGLAADAVGADTTQDLLLGYVPDVGGRLEYHKTETHAGGDDQVSNSATIDAHATATTNAGSVGITANGKASADASSSADASAKAIELGGGADTATNSGHLTSQADSMARALSVAASNKGRTTASDGFLKGGVEAKASAIGIDGGGAPSSSTDVIVQLDGFFGLQASYQTRTDDITDDGADAIVNTGNIDATSTATADAANVSVSLDGTAAAVTHVDSDAAATGIAGGHGDDAISNLGNGVMTVQADSQANAGTVAVSGKGLAAAADTLWNGGTTAQATATGIAGDGGSIQSTTVTAHAYEDALERKVVELGLTKVEKTGSADDGVLGNDSIVNEQQIDVTGTATAPSLGVALVAGKGVAATISAVETTASATAIGGGGGNDSITNRGALTATADATSNVASIAIADQGVAVAGGTLWDGSLTANATAIGIDGDGGGTTTKTVTLTVVDGDASIVYEKTSTADAGDDVIVNDGGAITAIANANANAGGAGLLAQGLAVALSQSSATASATAIRGGDGSDSVTNSGVLTSTATAIASSLNVAVAGSGGVAVAADAVWDGGTTATATAVGIDGDGGDGTTTSTITLRNKGDHFDKTDGKTPGDGVDTIINAGQIDAHASATSPEASVAVPVYGFGVATSTSTAVSSATAIAAGDGDDLVNNSGTLTASATSIAATANVAVTSGGVVLAGDAVWNGGTKATATAKGIDAGQASDTVTNDDSSSVDVTSTAITAAGDVAGAVDGVAGATATSTATSRATAIDGGDGLGSDTVTNFGGLTATANAVATAAAVSVTSAGVAAAADSFWNGGTTADAGAAGISTGDGVDTVTNGATINSTSNSVAGAADVSVAVSGVAAAMATSTSMSASSAIDLGGGADGVNNIGTLTANANALALSAAVTVTTAGLAVGVDALWDGGTTADAVARGIAAGAGRDTVQNGGQIDANATAVTGSADVSVAVTGVAGAIATSTADAKAFAIDAGDGNDADTVTNGGTLTATTLAVAGTVTVGVTTAGASVAGDSSWNGGTAATAQSRTISTGDGADAITNTGDLTAQSNAVTVSVPVSVAVAGVAAAVGTSTATAQSAAIDAGDGDDTIDNHSASVTGHTGTLVSDATADAAAAVVSVTPAGVAVASDAVWDGGTTANATAKGIDAGWGADQVTNASEITTTSTARALSADVAVAVAGVAGAIATSTANSRATAIDAGGDLTRDATAIRPDDDRVNNLGHLTADATALALSTPVSVTAAGVAVAGGAVWDGGTTSNASARGIASGSGDDAIVNDGQIDSTSHATTGSAAVSVAVAGVAAAIATSTATSNSDAIDAGDGADTIVNTGTLTADARALAGTVTVAVTPAGVSVAGDAGWNGGTHAEATSHAITAGAGDDVVTNSGDLNANATSVTTSAAVNVTVAGVGAAVGTSTAIARSVAIDAGDGADTVANINTLEAPDRSGILTATATAVATAPTVNVTPFGVSVASDAVWDGGTTANAAAAGIDAGLGADSVDNASTIGATSTAVTVSADVSVNVFGVAAAASTSTSLSSATAVETGAGTTLTRLTARANGTNGTNGSSGTVDPPDDDHVTNTGDLTATANATAVSAGVGFTVGGLSIAGVPTWDGGTQSVALARGISTSGGADTVLNGAQIQSTANAVSDATTASIAVFGVAGAISTASSDARSSAIDAGDGDDLVLNGPAGHLTSNANATGVAVNVAATLIGVAASTDSVWNGGTTATATATGIDGGAGLDVIDNVAAIDATSTSTTSSVAVSVAGLGAGGAISTSTSTANATAIDGGADADQILNAGQLTATSTATGSGVAVTVTGAGASVAGDATWNGGTAANATATGIAGGSGDDSVANAGGTVRATATSETHSVAVTATAVGLSFLGAESTSTARATALDGGDGSDSIGASGTLMANATATASGVGVAASLVGASVAGPVMDNVTKAEAFATGIAGGAGDDRLTAVDSLIALASSATTTDTQVSLTGVGFAKADSQGLARATAVGIDGGDGADVIENSGAITTEMLTTNGTLAPTLTAESKARAITVALGDGSANTSSRAETVGTGLDGGQGADVLVNHGLITLASTSTSLGQSVSVVPFGRSGSVSGVADIPDAGNTASATLVGLSGGGDNDVLLNDGIIILTPTASATGGQVNVSVAGATVNDGSTSSQASATGLDGGSGDDDVTNSGAIYTAATSGAIVKSTGVVVAGAAVNRSNATSDATAIGAGGGDGADRITNTHDGVIASYATATTTANGASVSVFGASASGGETKPTAQSTGLDGGGGDDTVVNDGAVIVGATATSSSTNSSTTITGSGATSGGTTSNAIANGLDGGQGDDLVLNRGSLTLSASSSAAANGSSWTLAGGAGDSSTLMATGSLAGITGGSGADHLRNDGQITATLESTLTANGGSDAIFGNASANTQLTAETHAFGIAGGDGADVIENAGLVDVSSTAQVSTTKPSVSFAGSPTTDALLVARAATTGLDGGNIDADRMWNGGTLSVMASSISNVDGGAKSTVFGGGSSSGTGTAESTATGVRGGDAANTITNAGQVDVTATGNSTVTNNASSGWLLGGGSDTLSNAAATVTALGVSTGDGSNVMMNDGEVRATSVGVGYGFAYASGAHVAFNGAGTAEANVNASALAYGLSAGNGRNTIVNNGDVQASSLASTVKSLTTTTNVCSQNDAASSVECHDETIVLASSPTYAGANGNGVTGDGTATALGTADAVAFGIGAGDGDNSILNTRTISVIASPDARTVVFADGDLDGDAIGRSEATARARSIGIGVGDGRNDITNTGAISVTATPTAQAESDVTGGDFCIFYLFGTWCGGGGTGKGTSKATITANSTGILAGDGANRIVNDGVLTVTAAPALAGFTTKVTGADTGGATLVTSVTSTALGIQTGNGNNQIVNDSHGVIDVETHDIPCGTGCTSSNTAVGIRTGAGDDVIENYGQIAAATFQANGSSQAGVAIDAGAGNDRVVLGEGSHTSGAVLLGAGNDRLVWTGGATLAGTADGGSSAADTFALGGRVNATFQLADIGSTFNGFNQFSKEGSSTWTLAGNRAIDWTVEQGTLAIQDTITGTVATSASGANAQVGVLSTGIVHRSDAAPAVVIDNGGLLTNHGIVEATAGVGVGVATVGENARVENAGTIRSAGAAVQMSGNDGSLVNAGTVVGTGATSTVVMAGTGNAVVNEADGTIQSVSGLAIQGGDGSDSVTNYGRISGGGDTSIDLGGGNDDLTIVGTASFDGTARGGAGFDTLNLQSDTASAFDLSAIGRRYDSFELMRKQGAGTLTLTGRGAGDWTLDDGTLAVDGDVTGTIASSAGAQNAVIQIDSSGSVAQSNGNAAVTLNGGALLSNSGVIVSGGVLANGVGNQIVNYGQIRSSDVGIRIAGSNNTVVNAGLVDGGAAGVAITGSGAILSNYGSIQGGSGPGIQGGAGDDVVLNQGSVSSVSGRAIDLAGGNDLLLLGASSRITGAVRGGAGFDTVQLIGNDAVTTDLSAFQEFEHLQKTDGGSWRLIGASDMGWDISAGTLVVDGALTGQGHVSAGGVLGGTGAVGSVLNDGIVAPGRSIGTLRVQGNYEQRSTGALDVEVDPTGAGDHLIVDGQALLHGGTLDIAPAAKRYGVATEYDVLSAAGGISGSFDTVASNSTVLDPLLEYGAKDLTLVLVRNDISFRSMGDTANAQAVGTALDANKRAMARGDFKVAMDQFLDMDETQQSSSLATLTGELHASNLRSLLRTSDRFFAASVDRRPSAQIEGERRVFWTDIARFSGAVAGDGNAGRAAYNATGLLGGVDFKAGDNGRVGVALGYSPGTTTLDGLGGDEAVTRSWMPSLYSEYNTGRWSLAGAFGYGNHSIHTERHVLTGTLARQARASYRANQYSGMLRGAAPLSGSFPVLLQAFGELRYSRLNPSAFSESGADSLDLVDGNTADSSSFTTLLGLHAVWSPKVWGATVKPELKLAWSREYMDLRGEITAGLSGAASFAGFQQFTTFGASDARNSAVVSLGGSAAIAKHGDAYVLYDGNLSNRGSDNGISAGVRVGW